jgi:hypothetical protein
MPEHHETVASHLGLTYLLEEIKHDHNWQVKGIWADATDAEQKTLPANHPGKNGLVFKLGPDSSIERGNQGAQTPVWPRWIPDANNTQPVPKIDALELNDVYYTSRALIIDFGPLWLQVFHHHPFIHVLV